MTDTDRREFLKLTTRGAGGVAALSMFPPSIRRARALPASQVTGTLADVHHVVILMQENRSFDHYFGTMRGVRGFGDRHAVPLASGKPVWYQSDGEKEVLPFHLDGVTTSALRVRSTPHSFADAQAAWNQGRFGFWPKFKTPVSMGHYRREDIPFQFALAEAFTICDGYHCSVTTGTDPNRIAFWSGSNFNPEQRRRGENCTDRDSEPDNLRCWIEGALPSPGYKYQGSALTWPTIPDVLERGGISWRIYQDPNDNWTGAMHGGLAFASFRSARPGSALYEKGMTHWSLEQLASDVRNDRLPQVSWLLPPKLWSEHPSPSSPLQGAEYISRVLDALTANPQVWGQTVMFLTFDENDGLFDHVPPPAPPSYNPDGTLAGMATLDLRGMYFTDPERKYLHPADAVNGSVRPWGLGPRVPMYVISPWSRGGWVNSQVFDHTSVGQFLERRFQITIPGISPWHRAICGDLTTAFDFRNPDEGNLPVLPRVTTSASMMAAIEERPEPVPPEIPEQLSQEPGVRLSRALPYELSVEALTNPADNSIALSFRNRGQAGAVFHVYDRLHLDRIPRRYTIEAGRSLSDRWDVRPDQGQYSLWIYGPNNFVREFSGKISQRQLIRPEATLVYDARNRSVRMELTNKGTGEASLVVHTTADRNKSSWHITIRPQEHLVKSWWLLDSHNWYDCTVTGEDFSRRFAGRMETGDHGISDPFV
jgi:phospholipase C